MRNFTILLVTVLLVTVILAACSTAPVTRNESPSSGAAQVLAPAPQAEPADSIVQFLLTSAATDFSLHRPPDPARFRNVRIGHIVTPGGEKQYMLCGQFLPAGEGGKAQWTSFATIKTSGYEQYIGGQAASFCQDSSAIWDRANDLSSSLQSRLDSLR